MLVNGAVGHNIYSSDFIVESCPEYSRFKEFMREDLSSASFFVMFRDFCNFSLVVVRSLISCSSFSTLGTVFVSRLDK